MLKFSDRAQQLPASPIRKLVPFADAAKDRGVRVYHLNIGQPDLETPQQFFDAVTQASLSVLSYSPSAGFESLRQEIAAYYGRLGETISEDDVLVTCGASEAINFVLTTVMDQGEEVSVDWDQVDVGDSTSVSEEEQAFEVTEDVPKPIQFRLSSLIAIQCVVALVAAVGASLRHEGIFALVVSIGVVLAIPFASLIGILKITQSNMANQTAKLILIMWLPAMILLALLSVY